MMTTIFKTILAWWRMPIWGHFLVNGMVLYIFYRFVFYDIWRQPMSAAIMALYIDTVITVIVYFYKRGHNFWNAYYDMWKRLDFCSTSEEVQELYYEWEELRETAFKYWRRTQCYQLDDQFDTVFAEFRRMEAERADAK